MDERLAVDPNLGSILFYGARDGNGLYKSTDYAATWTKVSTFPDPGTYVRNPKRSNFILLYILFILFLYFLVSAPNSKMRWIHNHPVFILCTLQTSPTMETLPSLLFLASHSMVSYPIRASYLRMTSYTSATPTVPAPTTAPTVQTVAQTGLKSGPGPAIPLMLLLLVG